MPDQGPEPSSIGQIGVALAAFLGVSYGIVESFDRLWVGLPVAVASALALTVFTVIGQQILKKVAPSVADKIIDICSLRGSRYKKYYLQHAIEFEHRTFDVKGLSTQNIYTLELEQVFVDLSLAPKVPHEASNNPIANLPEDLQSGRHSIWRYLDAGNGKPQHLVVLGAPGSGKTTLMKHLALSLALRKKAKPSATLPDWLPVLLFLRDHAKAIDEQENYGLIEAIKADLAHFKGQEPPAGWFEGWLGRGRCLILLDGLDEVANPDLRRKVVAWVEDQMAAYGQNRFVVTSRPFGYRDNPLEGVTVLDVRPFTAPQVETFVHNWYRANEVMAKAGQDDPGVRREAERGARDLISRLWGTPALSDLAVNPLLLTMIATVHRYRSSLPGRRVELYKEICEVFLGKRSQAKGQHLDLTPAQRQTVLQQLAYTMMQRETREVVGSQAELIIKDVLAEVGASESPGDFLRDTENNSGLLIEREEGVYAFAHLTFQEYLAAVQVSEQGQEDALTANISESWWHETIRLYAVQSDASTVIEACLAIEPIRVSALVLAIECQEEARKIAPALRRRLNKVLDRGLEEANSKTVEVIREALLALRLKRLIRIDEDCYIADSLISNAEYQLFLNDRQRQGHRHHPDHWVNGMDLHRSGNEPILGIRFEDANAFCSWLTNRSEGMGSYRLPRRCDSANRGIRDHLAGGYWALDEDGGSDFVNAGVADKRSPIRLEKVALGRIDFDRDKVLGRIWSKVQADDLVADLINDFLGSMETKNFGCLAKHFGESLGQLVFYIQELVKDRNSVGDIQIGFDLVLNLALVLDPALVNTLDRNRHLVPYFNTKTASIRRIVTDRDLVLLRAEISRNPGANVNEAINHLSKIANEFEGKRLRSSALVRLFGRDYQQDLATLDKLIIRIMLRKDIDKSSGDSLNITEFGLMCCTIEIYLILFDVLSYVLHSAAQWPSWRKRKYLIGKIAFDEKTLSSSINQFEEALQQIRELHRRIRGESQPFEGIRIVRERRKDNVAASAA